MKKLYLAGPDVFYPDATQRAIAHKALCRRYGFTPLHPIDQPNLSADSIYETNLEMLVEADLVLANLNPFRGPEVDSGTAFEVGFAVARGKPVIGYFGTVSSQKERVECLCGPLREENGLWFDRDGNLVENFGLPLNLMLAKSCQCVVGDLEAALQAAQRS